MPFYSYIFGLGIVIAGLDAFGIGAVRWEGERRRKGVRGPR